MGKISRVQKRFQNKIPQNPAYYYGSDGFLRWVEYYNDSGIRHRENGPAKIEYYIPSGFETNSEQVTNNILKEYWFKNGLLHNNGGPSVIVYDLKGNIIETIYHHNGKIHRIDGPARNIRQINQWWINDVHITTEVDLWLKENNFNWPFNEEEQFMFQMRFL